MGRTVILEEAEVQSCVGSDRMFDMRNAMTSHQLTEAECMETRACKGIRCRQARRRACDESGHSKSGHQWSPWPPQPRMTDRHSIADFWLDFNNNQHT